MAPTIETARLCLKPWTAESIDDVHLLLSDHDAMFWSLRGRSKSIQESQARLQGLLAHSGPKTRFDWLVYLRSDPNDSTSAASPTCVGHAAIWQREPQEPGSAEPGTTWVIAYALLAAHWGKGYATEMAEGMIQGMCDHIRPCTLQAYVNPENPVSHRVVGKLGFKLVEKVYKPEEPKLFIGGKWRKYDVWRYTRKLE